MTGEAKFLPLLWDECIYSLFSSLSSCRSCWEHFALALCVFCCVLCVLCLSLCTLFVSEGSSTLQIEGGLFSFSFFSFKSGIFMLLECSWLQDKIVSHFSHNTVTAFERLRFPQQHHFWRPNIFVSACVTSAAFCSEMPSSDFRNT